MVQLWSLVLKNAPTSLYCILFLSPRRAVFQLDVPLANAVAVVVGDEWTQLEALGGPSTRWDGAVRLAESFGRETKLFVCANYGSASSTYHTLLEYTM